MSYFRPKNYTKDISYQKPFFKHQYNTGFTLRNKFLPYTLPVLALIIFVLQVFAPLVLFTTQEKVSRPVTNTAIGKATGFSDFTFEELQEDVLGTSTINNKQNNIPKYYYLSIPKLGIVDAQVETNPANLDPTDALGHYIGSELPGDIGNSLIYGHSVLPIFYNPKNYKTIFSKLDKLEAGDEIIVNYNNKKYVYKVEGTRIENPDTIDPLQEIKPRYLNESTMVLMTCYPFGTKINRLMVDAVLVNE